MTLTLSDEKLATYRRVPAGFSAQPKGSVPTAMFLTTCRVAALITETVPLPWFVTYALALSGVMATHHGLVRTWTSATFVLTSERTSNTDTEPLSGFTLHTKRS